MIDPVQGPAVIFGLAGALLVASPDVRIRRGGFGVWIAGNLLWVIAGLTTRNMYLVVLFGTYWLLAWRGWHSNGGWHVTPDWWRRP